MILSLDPHDPEPLFQQIVAGVKHAVATGALQPGDRIPPVRELARDLTVNPNTIARAYQMLEAEGVTVSRRGAGTFVAAQGPVTPAVERRKRLRAALDPVLADAVHMGFTEDDVRRVFDEALAHFVFRVAPGTSR